MLLAVTGISLIALARAWLCHRKHVDRRNVGQMVVEEATPGRGGTLGRHVSPNRGLADLDAEFEQLAVDAAGAGWPGSSCGSDHGFPRSS